MKLGTLFTSAIGERFPYPFCISCVCSWISGIHQWLGKHCTVSMYGVFKSVFDNDGLMKLHNDDMASSTSFHQKLLLWKYKWQSYSAELPTTPSKLYLILKWVWMTYAVNKTSQATDVWTDYWPELITGTHNIDYRPMHIGSINRHKQLIVKVINVKHCCGTMKVIPN